MLHFLPGWKVPISESAGTGSTNKISTVCTEEIEDITNEKKKLEGNIRILQIPDADHVE